VARNRAQVAFCDCWLLLGLLSYKGNSYSANLPKTAHPANHWSHYLRSWTQYFLHCVEWDVKLYYTILFIHCSSSLCMKVPTVAVCRNWHKCALCGLLGCKNGPAPFPGRTSYKATKPGLVSVLYLSMFYIVLVFIRAPFMYC